MSATRFFSATCAIRFVATARFVLDPRRISVAIVKLFDAIRTVRLNSFARHDVMNALQHAGARGLRQASTGVFAMFVARHIFRTLASRRTLGELVARRDSKPSNGASTRDKLMLQKRTNSSSEFVASRHV
jgi:hypothetical protein